SKVPQGLLVVLLIQMNTVTIETNGKINAACDSMLPSHGNFVSQTTAAPYRISISSSSFDPGNKITGKLEL
uniref:Reelin domain-containing protein n=1 Tax=Gopherus evgoodei TaxID=1825980 RepID=A0A8C4WN38_9SAUR